MAKYNLMTNGKCDLYMFDNPIANDNNNQISDAIAEIINEHFPNYNTDNNKDVII